MAENYIGNAPSPNVTLAYTQRVFTSSGTWTKPPNLRKVKVTVVAGGGGGAGSGACGAGQGDAGSGGSAGGASIKEIAASLLGATETVTVGAAGTAGPAGVNGGGNGGSSAFGAHCSATGGSGGTPWGVAASAWEPTSSRDGGVGSGGDLNLLGGPGFPGMWSTTSNRAIGGAGGSSILGGGAMYTATTNSTGAAPAGGYGGGGSAAATIGNGPAQAGGAGRIGVVIIEEYCDTVSMPTTATVASQPEMETATANDRLVTPAMQKYHPGHPKAWVNFTSANPPVITASYNVASVTRASTGVYTVNFTTPMSSANYCVVVGGCNSSGVGNTLPVPQFLSTTNVTIVNTGASFGVVADTGFINVVVYGDQ